MRSSIIILLVSILVACSSSGTRPAGVAAADVSVRLAAPLFFGSGRTSAAALDVNVTNRANVPVTLRRIHISASGMLQYTIRPLDRIYNDTLAPGETKPYHLTTEAIASTPALTPTEPLNVRVDVDFEATGRRYREIFNIVNVQP